MSRIEKALKKTAGARESQSGERSHISGNVQSAAQPVKEKLSVPSRISELLNVVPLKITNLMLATARDEKSDVVEEYNKLRSSLIALTRGNEFQNTIMVTSTVSDEGKSMTALNLAISMAKEHDHTVLLVDADLRRPSVHKYLDINPELGLIHCLRDGVAIEEALIKTGIGKLVVLPAGDSVRDPVDLLSSNRMKTIVKELKERYPERYVIFDTPPSMPFADAAVLSEIVDATLFVVREGKAKEADVTRTLAEYRKKNLLGIVYNDARILLKNQSYYGYY
jgi:exopolysaccharide/PEP-CTERM locus tyrosine autokinase